MKKKGRFCYACGAKAVTTEHVPPRSFFPKPHRERGLMTVPSCVAHNNDNSSDVEYVRNIIGAHFDTPDEVQGLLNPTIWRSFERSPTLLNKTFSNIEAVFHNGQRTGVFTVNMGRVAKVMSAIASAMYFLQYERLYLGTWEIFSPATYGTDEIKTGKPSNFQIIRDMLPRLAIRMIDTPQPENFACGVSYETPQRLIFMFKFYSGIEIFALAVPFWEKRPMRRA